MKLKQAKYLVLAANLEKAIQRGEYPAGTRLPSENELTAQHGISRQTVRQALAELEKKDLILRKQGSGTLVKASRAAAVRSGNIGVIATFIGEYIFPSMLRGIEEGLAKGGYSPTLSATRNRLDKESAILTEYLDRPIDGLIVEGTKTALPNPNIELYEKLAARGVPILFVHGFYPELRDWPHVVAADAVGGYNAVRFLQSKGHKNIGGIFKSDDVQGHQRYGGYIRGLQKIGLPIVDDRVLWYNTENRRELVDGYALKALEDCSAVVCYNDEVAVQVLDLLLRAGRRVPQDMAIISFDNSTYGDLTPVKISSFNVGEKQLGRMAADKLLGLVDGKPQKSAVLPWTLVEKESI